jgi:acetyltransferase-like isoleucine patch superfamily enzyme
MDNIFFDKKKLKYCGENVIIGKTVRIRKPIDDFAYISCAIEIGKNCHIASHVSISGGSGKFKMGDYSTISNHCSIHCASSDYTIVSLDLPSVPKELQFGGEVGDVILGDFVTIGAHSCILPSVNIPNGLSCGAHSLIKHKDVLKGWSLYVGSPLKFIRNRNTEQLQNWLNNNNINYMIK